MIAVTYSCGHTESITTTRGDEGGGAVTAGVPCPYCHEPETVAQADLFGYVHDTGRSESELNGWLPCGMTRNRRPKLGWRRLC